jgi:hypothetical protein
VTASGGTTPVTTADLFTYVAQAPLSLRPADPPLGELW